MSNEVYYDQNVYYNGETPNPNSDKKGLAIAALVLGIVSFLGCCCGLGFIAAPLSIIFAIIALVKRHGGTAMSIVGIVLSAITLICTALFIAVYGQAFKDYFKFRMEADVVIEEYEETGELPDYLDKYNDDKYSSFWRSAGYRDFNAFFEEFAEEFKSNSANSEITYQYDDDDVEIEVNLG